MCAEINSWKLNCSSKVRGNENDFKKRGKPIWDQRWAVDNHVMEEPLFFPSSSEGKEQVSLLEQGLIRNWAAEYDLAGFTWRSRDVDWKWLMSFAPTTVACDVAAVGTSWIWSESCSFEGLPASWVSTVTRWARVDGQKRICDPGGFSEEHSSAVFPAANRFAPYSFVSTL